MHLPSLMDERVAGDLLQWVVHRLAHRATTLPSAALGQLPEIASAGHGVESAWAVLRDEVLPTSVPSDHPGYLAFIPGAPSVAAVLADIAVSAAAVYAGSELEAGAVVGAERAALRWLADLAGLPAEAHGTFVSGGTVANLSALVAARRDARLRRSPSASVILAGRSAHSSVAAAASVMDCVLVSCSEDPDARLTAAHIEEALATLGTDRIVAVVATAGTTNAGVVDELDAIARTCHRHGVWFHVDAAYGGGGLLSSRTRPLFTGIGEADSVTIDPHKWFFTPFDCAAVVYRDPQRAKPALMQRAPYLDVVDDGDNPSDYAIQLTRRARGIPLWLSLIANGTQAYVDAVERCLDLTTYAAQTITGMPCLELLMEPSLSIVLFRRRGWQQADYAAWSQRAIVSGLGLITPTIVRGDPALRLCFVNPLTDKSGIDRILASLN